MEKNYNEERIKSVLDKYHNDYFSLYEEDYQVLEFYIDNLENLVSKLYKDNNNLRERNITLASALMNIDKRVK